MPTDISTDMPHTLTLRGLPNSLAQDGWWLSSPADTPEPPKTTRPQVTLTSPRKNLILGAIILIFIADFLFWKAHLGLSLALFACAVFAVATWDRPLDRKQATLWGILILSALPVVEYLQTLSVLFLMAGLSVCTVAARLSPATARNSLWGALALILRWPVWGMSCAVHALITWGRKLMPGAEAQGTAPDWVASARTQLRNWLFPVGGALVFAALMLEANPVLESWTHITLDLDEAFTRVLFWTGIALMVWPFLSLPAASLSPRAPRTLPDLSKPLGINGASTLRALWMFNLVIGLQSAMDLSILFGGATLPEGMSYASYAHRGAYPLLATAMLAGGFAVLARPFLGTHPMIKPLMLLWLGQNILLCAASLVRLQLYVEAYGLSYLRLHAMIWIGLVAACLVLCIWQAVRARSTGWLSVRAALLGALTLYTCCFVNFAHVIARHNIAHVGQMDALYLCKLGPTAAAARAPHIDRINKDLIPARRLDYCLLKQPQITDWRDWGFRNWRVSRSLSATLTQSPRGIE